MLKHFTIIAAVIMLLFASLLTAQTKAEDVKVFSLKNGMKFMVLEDHSIPNAVIYTFFKVGSRNEYPGITGLSHFFEHMMFNGAKKYGPGEFDRVMEAHGGSNNAYTSEDITVYYDRFPSDSIEIMFDLEGDRIGDLALDDKMVESERGVVMSERITGLENRPFEILDENVIGAAFLAHSYRWSVIGYDSDIKNWSKEDLQRYFDTYYAPNNAVCIVSGDVTLQQVKKLAEKYYGHIPSRKPPRPVHLVEPPQKGEKRVWVHKDVSTPHLIIAYHVPNSRHEDYYALDMLDSILTQGKSSRLYRALVEEKQLVVQIGALLPPALDPTLYKFFAVCSTGITEQEVEKAIYQELDKIINEGVSEQELQKVKNFKLMSFYRSMETIAGKSNTIGRYEIFFGGFEKLFNAPDEYNKVTAADIQRVAKTYFRKNNRTVGILKKEEEK